MEVTTMTTELPEHLATVFDRVKAKAAAAGRIAPEDDQPSAYEVVQDRRAMIWHGMVPTVYGNPTVDQLDPRVAADIAWWAKRVRSGHPCTLLLTGPVGTGKTHAAWAALRAVWDLGLDVAAVSVPDYLASLRPATPEAPAPIPPSTMRRCDSVGVLLLDELAGERGTDWTVERLSILIHRRWERRLSCVATTNLEPGPLAEALGERAYSRLVDDVKAIRITGDDRRRA
jgi:DNA replication protein DnaC